MKFCRICYCELYDETWSPSSKKKRDYICKQCSITKVTKWANDNPDKVKYRWKHWAEKNPEKRKLSAKKSWLKRRYGLTLEQYEKMLKESKGVCQICGKTRPLCIDHSHVTGRIRGLICKICNSHIGWLENYNNQIKQYLDIVSNYGE